MKITKNKKYLYYNDTIVDTETFEKYENISSNPLIVCEVLQNQCEYFYKNRIISEEKIFEIIQNLSSSFLSLNEIDFMTYQVRFGLKLLTEKTQNNLESGLKLIEENWEYIREKLVEYYENSTNIKLLNETSKNIKLLFSDEKFNWIFEGVYDTTNWVMTKIEDFLLSLKGVALSTFLMSLGIGVVTNVVMWGAIAVWKIYKIIAGKLSNSMENWFDVAICLVGAVFGGAVKYLKTAIKGISFAAKNLRRMKSLQPIRDLLNLGSTKVTTILESSKNFLKKLRVSGVDGIFSKVGSWLTNFFEKMMNFLNDPKTSKAALNTVAASAVYVGLDKAIDKMLKSKENKKNKQNNSEYEQLGQTMGNVDDPELDDIYNDDN